MSRPTRTILASILLLSVVLSGCVGSGPKSRTGGALGAASGGLIAGAAGAGPAGIIGGVLLGGLVGSAIGDSLDQRDRELAMQQAQLALESSPTGESRAWHNPDSGNSGTVTPTRTYQGSGGQYCREYQQTIEVGGEKQQAYGTACRQPDGSWQVQN